MGRFSMWFANLMRGRYGMDQLNRALTIVALIFIVINFFFIRDHQLIAVVFADLHLLQDVFAEYSCTGPPENQRYLQPSPGYVPGFQRSSNAYGTNTRTKDKTHKILKCPGCGEKLRVPKGVGKISISCPHCHTKFQKSITLKNICQSFC